MLDEFVIKSPFHFLSSAKRKREKRPWTKGKKPLNNFKEERKDPFLCRK